MTATHNVQRTSFALYFILPIQFVVCNDIFIFGYYISDGEYCDGCVDFWLLFKIAAAVVCVVLEYIFL